VVEEFIVGPQVAAEAVVCEGRPHVVGVADRTLEDGRVLAAFLVARGGECPSRLPAGTCRGVEAAVEEAVGALGLEAATVRADLVVGRDGPVVTELGIGLSGRFASTHEIPLATGVDLVGAAIRLALGETPADEALVPRWSQAVATRALFALPGAVLAVRGRAEAAAGDGIALLEVWARPGDRVGTSPVGAVVAVGETHEEAMLRADAAVARVRVLTQPAVAPPSLTVH
jgi:biotin carboxylase